MRSIALLGVALLCTACAAVSQPDERNYEIVYPGRPTADDLIFTEWWFAEGWKTQGPPLHLKLATEIAADVEALERERGPVLPRGIP